MRHVTLGTAALMVCALGTPAQAQKESEILKVQQVIATMVEKGPGMQAWFDDAYGYAVFPNVGKGAFGVGAAQASAVATLTLGASADSAYNKGVAVITMTNAGLMYEAAVGGQKFK